jgi:hypothetical protein
VCETTNKAHSLDKLVATGIQQQLSNPEASTYDGCAGWHVICGKHFALSITYNTKWTLFFDLLEGCNKTFLVFKTQWVASKVKRTYKIYHTKTIIISLRKLQKNDVYAVIKFKFQPPKDFDIGANNSSFLIFHSFLLSWALHTRLPFERSCQLFDLRFFTWTERFWNQLRLKRSDSMLNFKTALQWTRQYEDALSRHLRQLQADFDFALTLC